MMTESVVRMADFTCHPKRSPTMTASGACEGRVLHSRVKREVLGEVLDSLTTPV